MRANAPGKIVLSGAYAVLEGAPAVVAAVDRYAVADSARRADRITPEVAAALAVDPRAAQKGAPWFDASALRAPSRDGTDRKLGLGSSAAILVASLAAIELGAEPGIDERALADRVFAPALAAHRGAQGGGSGVDVAAAAFGGILLCRIEPATGLRHRPVRLPDDLVVEVWSGRDETSTREMLGRVRDFRDAQPNAHDEILFALREAAGRAAGALHAAESTESAGTAPGAAPPFLSAIREQRDRLRALGVAAGCPIVPGELDEPDRLAESRGAIVIPSGAGGLEVVLFLGLGPSDPEVVASLTRAGLDRLEVGLGARGVHAADSARS